MRSLPIAIASVALLAACGSEKSSTTGDREVTVQDGVQATPDSEAESGENVSPDDPKPTVVTDYNQNDIPPCLSIYDGATRVRAERKKTQYGAHHSLGYVVDAPIQEVADYYMRTVRERGCRIDHTDSRHGIEQFTIYTDGSVKSGKSSGLQIIAMNKGTGPLMVSANGSWLEP